MSAEDLKLGLFSQSTFSAPVSPALLATSPTLNLAATVTNDNTLVIRRARGEVVSSSSERGKTVQALCWKADGQFLAVAWDDGTVRLLGVENTKAVHRINVAQQQQQQEHAGAAAEQEPVPVPVPITYIAWARNLTGKRHFNSGHDELAAKLRGLGLDDDGAEGSSGGDPDAPVDLPHALTFLEIDASLPKISPLPVSGGTGDDMFVFSTTASLESMFPPLRAEDNDVVDVMVVGTRDGCVHLSIYDSFSIGSFRVPVSRGPSPASSQDAAGADHELFLHAAHPEVSTHSLLLRPRGDDKPRYIYLAPMDLRFVSYSPVNLSLLASKTTTLQKLLRYIKQTQIHIVNEWQSTRELPSRFLNFIQQDLQKMKSGPTDIVQALCHTVLTGHVYPPVREWLVDSIGDRGHKRWEKAVAPGLESLRNLIHENMLPALERSTLILSRLSGIARFHEHEDAIGFTNAEIIRLVDVLAALNLVCHRALLVVMEELDLFRMFSSWLRITIDRVSSGTVSDEIMEKEALLDPAKILRYIERYLASSPMAVYFEKLPKDLWDEGLASTQECAKMLDEVDEQLRREEAGKPYKKALPQASFLVDLLAQKARDVFQNIAYAEKRSVRFGRAVELEVTGQGGPETPDLVDARMCRVGKPNGVDGVTYVAVVTDENPHRIGIFENKIEIINGVSSVSSTNFNHIDLDPEKEGRIIDVKFLSDHVLVILCQQEGQQPGIFCSPYRNAAGDQVARRLKFTGDLSSFTPVRMEVKEANESRGGVPARVCLLGKDGVSYKVFAMPPHDELLHIAP